MTTDAIWSWYNAAPARYWLTALPFVALLIAATFRPRNFPPWVYLAAVTAFVFAFRWPFLVYGLELNVDEGQLLAGAVTLKSHPVFWKYVDAHAGGPLDIYPLTLMGWLGIPLNYGAARLFGLGMILVSLVSIYRLLRECHGELLARAAVLVPAAYIVFIRFYDVVHYSSETVPAALVSLGMACLWIGILRGSPGILFAGGLAMGAVPWAKLQAVPVALTFTAGAALFLWQKWAEDRPRRLRLAAWMVAGGLGVSLLFAVAIAFNGLWSEWWTSYINAAVNYAGAKEYRSLETLANFLGVAKFGFCSYALPQLSVVGILFGAVLFHGKGRRQLPLAMLASTAAAMFVIAMPGRMYPHYTELLVFPLAGLAGSVVGAFIDGRAGGEGLAARRWFVPATVAAFLGVTVVPQGLFTFSGDSPQIMFPDGTQHTVICPAAEIILQNSKPGDAMTVWGWETTLYVQTGLRQGTREAHTERQILPGPLASFYRARFLSDLQANKPEVFVDAVGPDRFAYRNRQETGHEIWPELRKYIALHYRQIADVEGFRVYIAVP